MALQRGAGPRQLRILLRKFEQVSDDGPACRAVVAEQHFGGAQMQFFDGSQAREPERLARDHDRQRQRGGECKGEPEEAEAFAACEQILDQIDDAEPEPKQHQPADGGPEQRTPAEAPPHRHQRRIDRYR